MIKNINSDGWVFITKQDTYGGMDLHVGAGHMLLTLMAKINAHLDEHEKEQALREKDPSVKLAWESYQMAVAMAKEPA